MLPYLLLLSFLYISLQYNINAFEPSCTSCKHFIESKINPDLGCCKMFNNFIYNVKGKEKNIYDYAVYCRNNENMCGKSGFLYENIKDDENLIKNTNNSEMSNDSLHEKQLSDMYEELNNRCCGEVNEEYEIEQLEREFFDLFQKIKRYNTKRIYKTTWEIYKLFKNK
jgi:hypothetical protein